MRLTLAYDGTEFYGAQAQPGRRTVASEVEGALARLAGQRAGGPAPRLTFAGRTDRGVHAVGQVAHCDLASRLDDERLRQALNALLPDDLAVIGVATVAPAFHARYDAVWREYRYRVWNAPVREPLLARTAWHVRPALDRGALDEAARALHGGQDFAAFAGQGLGLPAGTGGSARRSTVREVYGARWFCLAPDLPRCAGALLELRIRASGFLPQMVRTVVAALVEVGSGRREPAWIGRLLEARDRHQAPAPAPPQGLTFWEVGYTLGDTRPAWRDGMASDEWIEGVRHPSLGKGR